MPCSAVPRIVGGISGLNVGSAKLFGMNLNPTVYPKRYAAFCVVVFVLFAIGVANLRRGRAGRRWVSVRVNERGAASLGISVSGAKIGAFAISGALAGAGGALLTFRSPIATFSSGFDVSLSIVALGYAVVAGLGLVAGFDIGGAPGVRGCYRLRV